MEAVAIQQREKVNTVDWDQVIAQFPLTPEFAHLGSSQFLASHARPIRDAISYYSSRLDENPINFILENEQSAMARVRESINQYFNVGNPDDIATTDSTTMGLGLLYTGLNVKKGCEILVTDHDHYSHYESIHQACLRTGASWRKIKLYDDIDQVSKEEILTSIVENISEETRFLSLTWVHSNTGLKIPVTEICAAVHEINRDRDGDRQIKTIIDGVHGFGIETETFKDIACDFFITSGHKWIYGPRGTGFVAGRHDAWQLCTPVIPSYSDAMERITEGERPMYMDGKQMTPGGFHSFEYRWALKNALDWIMSIGKENICQRVRELSRLCKEGLKQMAHVRLITPMSEDLSSGIICFEVQGMTPEQVVKNLNANKVIATVSPYKKPYVRFTPGIINTPDDIHKGLDAISRLGQINW
jgi:isopenicillin-N epimerase